MKKNHEPVCMRDGGSWDGFGSGVNTTLFQNTEEKVRGKDLETVGEDVNE